MNIGDIVRLAGIVFVAFVLFILAYGKCAGTTAADYSSWAMDILEAWRRRFIRLGNWIVALVTWVMPAQNRTDIVGRRLGRLAYDLRAQIRATEKMSLPTNELKNLLSKVELAQTAWKKEDGEDWRRMRSLDPGERWRDLRDLTEKAAERKSDVGLDTAVLVQRARLELNAAVAELRARADALYYDKGYLRRKYP